MNDPYSYGGSQYIRDCHPVCQTSRTCQYPQAIRALAAAQQVLNQAKEERIRSVASEWCEIVSPAESLPEGHPFNGKQGKVVFQREIHWPDGTVDSSGSITMCIRHGKDTGLMPGPKDDIVNGEITSGDSEHD